MESQKRNPVLSNSLALGLESNNTCSVYLTISPAARGGKKRYSALRRSEIPRGFIARFHTKYQKSSGCWLWTAGSYRGRGYGMVNLGRNHRGQQHTTYAHRVAYVLAKGDIPQGQVVMHTCDVTACVNPDHLILGTQGDNVRDAATKGHYNGPRSNQVRKLSDEQVREIRASNEKGVRLSVRYGVSQAAISLIRRGLARKAA